MQYPDFSSISFQHSLFIPDRYSFLNKFNFSIAFKSEFYSSIALFSILIKCYDMSICDLKIYFWPILYVNAIFYIFDKSFCLKIVKSSSKVV